MVEMLNVGDFWEKFRLSQNPSGSNLERERATKDARSFAHSILSTEAGYLREGYDRLAKEDPFLAKSAYSLLRETGVMETTQLREILGMPPRRHIHR